VSVLVSVGKAETVFKDVPNSALDILGAKLLNEESRNSKLLIGCIQKPTDSVITIYFCV
jgi:hypothetical protein